VVGRLGLLHGLVVWLKGGQSLRSDGRVLLLLEMMRRNGR